MMWDLPLSVNIDGKEYAITNRCDYRMVLDVICALNDPKLNERERINTALYVFYEDLQGCDNVESAIKEMFKIISYGEEDEAEDNSNKPRLMDWQHDFAQIAPPVSRVLGYEVRTADRYTHWYTFLCAYMEIGECTFQNVVAIRSKKAKGKKLDDSEREFYRENKKMVDLPHILTEEEQEWLDSDW
jgi:hypothetical protein